MKFSAFSMLSFLNEAILVSAFIYGIINILVKKGASYFKFLVCAVGCYSIAELLRLAYFFCYGEQGGITGMFSVGYFGCFLFMFSAVFKPFDSIVDDGAKSLLKYRIIPLAVPIIFFFATFAAYLPIFNTLTAKNLIIIFIMNVPKFAASYYNVKHLIFPDIGCGFLSGVRLCNIFCLLIYIMDILYTYAAVITSSIGVLLGGFLFNLCCIGLMFAAKRGIQKWKA